MEEMSGGALLITTGTFRPSTLCPRHGRQHPQDIMEEVPRHARSFVLMHDSGAKSQTVNALDGVIKELKQHGYTLDKLTNRIKPVVFKY
jgi:peptidoglycan/xylan/chitin deacetylase (PgdA/CDA1 family)